MFAGPARKCTERTVPNPPASVKQRRLFPLAREEPARPLRLFRLLGLIFGFGVGLELLDAERDPLLFDIDVEHLDPDDLALAVVVHRLLAGPAPIDIGEMHHAVDIAGKTDEQTELGDIADLALDRAADRVLLG